MKGSKYLQNRGKHVRKIDSTTISGEEWSNNKLFNIIFQSTERNYLNIEIQRWMDEKLKSSSGHEWSRCPGEHCSTAATGPAIASLDFSAIAVTIKLPHSTLPLILFLESIKKTLSTPS